MLVVQCTVQNLLKATSTIIMFVCVSLSFVTCLWSGWNDDENTPIFNQMWTYVHFDLQITKSMSTEVVQFFLNCMCLEWEDIRAAERNPHKHAENIHTNISSCSCSSVLYFKMSLQMNSEHSSVEGEHKWFSACPNLVPHTLRRFNVATVLFNSFPGHPKFPGFYPESRLVSRTCGWNRIGFVIPLESVPGTKDCNNSDNCSGNVCNAFRRLYLWPLSTA